MYEFCLDYMKPKSGEKTNYVTWIQTAQSLFKNKRHLLRHWKDVKTKFDTSNYKLDRSCLKRNKKVSDLMKDGSS